jgi:hypothetical protein
VFISSKTKEYWTLQTFIVLLDFSFKEVDISMTSKPKNSYFLAKEKYNNV